jgi:hypothetical protein
VTQEHGGEALLNALGDMQTGGEFVNDNDVLIRIETGEKNDGVMTEAVVHSGEPLEAVNVIEGIEDVDVVTEGIEELAGGHVPLAFVP